MVKSLDDPYTVFLKPEDNKKFLEDVSGSFEGIGIEIGIKKKQLQVISVLEGTPAEKAGLRAGDKIIKINDNLTSDLTIDEAVSLIRGKKGTEVSLSIFRDDWDSIKEIKIIRDRINIPSIKWELKEGDIAYIKINQFSAKSDYDFLKTAIEILNSPAKKIILDLRNNPGGYLEVAVDMAGWFLKKGDTVVIEDFKNDKDDVVYKAKGNSKFLNYPIVVLINNSSASAAEILAAALQENRNIKLIGEKSFGKGSVQKIEELSDKSALKITVANWLTPKGKVISKEGLTPDIKVEMTEEDYQNKRDPQLDKAIEIIKNIM
jgi:carboxyl-terminal processing protease